MFETSKNFALSKPKYSPTYIRAKTNAIRDYHNDPEEPGRPLYLLIPGGLIALASLALIVYIVYRVWFDESLPDTSGWPLLMLLAPLYIGGVFLFSYGYELYDVPKAIRLTAIIVFITLAAVMIVAVLGFLLGGSKDSDSKSSSSSSSKSSSSSGGSFSLPSLGTSSSGTGSGSGGGGSIWPDIYIGSGSHTTMHEVTHEVVREVPVAPPAPLPIVCPNCGRSYVPEENKFACPNCGAPTPAELIPADARQGSAEPPIFHDSTDNR